MGFGKRLNELIEYRKTNVNRISKITGIGTQTLYMIIKRDSESVNPKTVSILANALGVNASYFYDERYKFNEHGQLILDVDEISNVDEAKEILEDFLRYDDLFKKQADAIRILFLELERMKYLEKENRELKEKLNV